MLRPGREMDRSLLKGLAWTGAFRWGSQLLSWGGTIIVARLLSPADYGLAGMAGVYIGFTQLLCEAGLVAALLRHRNDDRVAQAQLGGFAALLGLACCVCSILLSGPIAGFFGQPAVRALVIVSSFGFLPRGIQVLPRGMMQRTLDFRHLAWVDGVEALSLSAATLTLAALGMGVWALVCGGLVGAVMGAVVSFYWYPVRLRWPSDLRAIATDVIFGGKVLGSQLAWYAYNNSDFAVVGKFLGSQALGAYTLGWTIANVPVDRISSLVNRVTPAYFARLSHERETLRRYLLRLSEGLALATFPACVGLALIARDLVITVLGPGWEGAVAPLQILAAVSAVRSLFVLAAPILVFTGQVERNLSFSLLLVLILPISFVIGTRWGVTGVAIVWASVYPVVASIALVRPALRSVRVSWSAYLDALRTPLFATIVMTAAVLALPAGAPRVTSLILKVSVGALVYTATAALLLRSRLIQLLALLRGNGEPAPRTPPGPAPDRRRLILVSYHYPPDPSVGGLRWQQLAEFAVARGWDIEVVSRAHGRGTPSVTESGGSVRVHHIAEPWLPIATFPELLWRWLPKPARFRHLRPPASAPGSIASDDLRRRPHARHDLRRWYFAWLDRHRGRAWGALAAEYVDTLVHEGDVAGVISSGPPHPPHGPIREVAEREGIPFILDLRDPWSLVQRLPESIASPYWISCARRDERRAIDTAALVLSTTDAHRDALRLLYPERSGRIITVRNGCDGDPITTVPPRGRFLIAYAGSVYIDRDPSPLFQAAATLIRGQGLGPGEFGIEFVGEVATFNGVPLTALAEQAGIAGYFRSYPHRPRSEVHEFLAGASLLVLLPQDSDLAIPAKVYEYARFPAGILALAESTSATGQLLAGTAADLVSPFDTSAIAAVLRRRYEEFRRGIIPAPLAEDLRFHRAGQAEILFDAIAQVTRPQMERSPRLDLTVAAAAGSRG